MDGWITSWPMGIGRVDLHRAVGKMDVTSSELWGLEA